MNDNERYVIRNVLHVGSANGPRGASKVGQKYEERKNRPFTMDVNVKKFRKSLGKNAHFSFDDGACLVTTPVVYIMAIGKRCYLFETANTMYIIERVKN